MTPGRAVILAAPSVQRPRAYASRDQTINEHLGAQLPYVFLVSRLAHYLKCVQRERIGQWLDRSALERELELWLRSVAAPIQDAERRTVAALNVSSAASRVPLAKLRDEILPSLLTTADAVSTALGRSARTEELPRPLACAAS